MRDFESSDIRGLSQSVEDLLTLAPYSLHQASSMVDAIDVIYCYIIWTDNGSMLRKASTPVARGEISTDESIARLHP